MYLFRQPINELKTRIPIEHIEDMISVHSFDIQTTKFFIKERWWTKHHMPITVGSY